MKNKTSIFLEVCSVLTILVSVIALLIFVELNSFNTNPIILNNTTDTIIDNGDVWYSLEDSTNKIEWRHIKSSNDTMVVIHIHQGDSLYTWIGKPCNCY